MVAVAVGPLHAPAGEGAAAAERDHVGPGDGEAAVDQRDDRRGAVAAGPQDAGDLDAVDCCGDSRCRRPRRCGAGREKICGEPRIPSSEAASPDERPLLPASGQVADLARASRRTRKWSSSPASITVEPRGGSASPVADDQVDQCVARQPELLDLAAHGRVVGVDPVGEACRRRAPGSFRSRPGTGGGPARPSSGRADRRAARTSSPGSGSSRRRRRRRC